MAKIFSLLQVRCRDLLQASSLLFVLTTVTMLLPFYIGGPFLIVVTLVLAFEERKDCFGILRSWGWIGVAWLLAGIVALWHRNVMGMTVTVCLGLTYYFFSLYRRRVTPRLYLFLLELMSFASIGTSLWAIIAYLLYIQRHELPLMYILQAADPGYRAMATLFNANYYGLFCIFAILIGAYMAHRSRGMWQHAIYLISVFLNIVGIILTASRMVLPALVVGSVVLMFFLNRKWALWTMGLGLMGLLVVIFVPTIFPRFGSLVSGLEEREWIWGAAWRLFLDYPLLGRGPMSYATYFYLYEGKGQPHAHQLLLEILSSYGLYGLMCYLVGAVPFMRQLVALYRQRETHAEVGLITAMIATVLVHGLMDVSIMWLQTGYVFLLVILCPVTILREVATTSLQEVDRHLVEELPFV